MSLTRTQYSAKSEVVTPYFSIPKDVVGTLVYAWGRFAFARQRRAKGKNLKGLELVPDSRTERSRRVGSLLIASMLLLAWTLPLHADTPITLFAENLYINTSQNYVEATGNVAISIEGTHIRTEHLYIETQAGNLIATQGVTLERGAQSFTVPSLHYHIDSQRAQLTDVRIRIHPPDAKAPIFLTAKTMENTPSMDSGTRGLLTSCDLEHPHYYLQTDYFDLDPEREARLYNMFFYYPIGPIPFGFWSPMYVYALGKRDIIWNFPTIGRKDTPGWGWFVQNTIDYGYVRGMDASLLLDWFENKGFGFGIQHPWDMGWLYGKTYAYTFTQTDTGQHNYKLGFSPSIEIGNFKLKGDYQKVNGVKILSSGREETEQKSIAITHTDIREITHLSTEDHTNTLQKYRMVSHHFFYEINQERNWEWRGTDTYYFNRNQRLSTNTLTQEMNLPWKSHFKNTLTRDEDISLTNDYLTNDRLITNTQLTSQLADDLKLTIAVSHLFDLDEDRVTTDTQNGQNNFLYKHPEISVAYQNSETFPMTWTQKVTVARYQEVQFDFVSQKKRTFPAPQNYTWEPNTYISNTTLDKHWERLPFSSLFSLSAHADQYIFKAEDRDIFSGDALYTVGLTAALSSDIGGFLKTRSDYTTRLSPEDNHSPFFAFDRNTQALNEINQSMTFYLFSENQYHWRNTSGYNWIFSRWQPYRTQIFLKPIDAFSATLQTGYILNPNSFYESENRYEPLNILINLRPTENIRLDYSLSLDINELKKTNRYMVNRSNLGFGVALGKDPDYRWDIRGNFGYNTRFQTGNLELGRYELQTLTIVKQEHCREFSLGYNKPLEEFQIQFTIKAYPDDRLGILKTRDAWKIEGIADKTATERL